MGVRAAKEKKFLIGISEAQEVQVIDSLATSSNRLWAAHVQHGLELSGKSDSWGSRVQLIQSSSKSLQCSLYQSNWLCSQPIGCSSALCNNSQLYIEVLNHSFGNYIQWEHAIYREHPLSLVFNAISQKYTLPSSLAACHWSTTWPCYFLIWKREILGEKI
jgi:hypothetical protein